MEYEKCLVQVYEILNHLDEEEILKIPERLLKSIEEKMDKNYKWTYDETKDLINQDVNRKTIAILSYINLEYLLNKEEKEFIINMHEANEEKLFPKVGTVNFNNVVEYETSKEAEEKNVEHGLLELNKQKWYQKIWNRIKQLFNK